MFLSSSVENREETREVWSVSSNNNQVNCQSPKCDGSLIHKSDLLVIPGVKIPWNSNHSLESLEENTKSMYNVLIQDKLA